MACEGHPPSSHAQFESVLQQALKDFPHVDSLREEQKDCIQTDLLKMVISVMGNTLSQVLYTADF